MTAGSVTVPTIVPLRAPVPGKPKFYIDTDTKVELATTTEGATIYYTINGLNPAPFQKHGPEAKATLRYNGPFRLPGGKRTVKAIAIASDGIRESYICSKAFEVEDLGYNGTTREDDGTQFISELHPSDSAKRDVAKFANRMMTSKEAWEEVQKMRDAEDRFRPHSGGPLYLSSRLGNLNSNLTEREVLMNALNSEDRYTKRNPPTNATQSTRLQRETDFLKCLYCFAPRPADPFARFCNECGSPVPALPQTRIAPPEPGQMGTCFHCHSKVPFNTPRCLICEAPIPPQNVPQASVRLADKTICLKCGTGNPANISICVMCNEPLALFTTFMPSQNGSPSNLHPRREGRFLSCTKCGRVNNIDARFCDWCGAKPAAPDSQLICGQCKASNNPYARYCGSCSSLLEPPVRPEIQNAGSFKVASLIKGDVTSPQWLPVSTGPPTAKFDAGTQTVGLVYPSQRSITQGLAKEEEKMKLQQSMSDKKPVLTAISPGKGYWRKQIDHIGSHIKAEAAGNPEFRSLISEPRMTKIVSTAVHEDGHELSLTVTFALKGNRDPLIGEPLGYSKQDLLSAYTRTGSMGSFSSDGEAEVTGRTTGRSTKRGTKKKTKKRVVQRPLVNLPPQDKELLKAVNSKSEPRPSEVQQLLEEGADANVCTVDGIPVIHLAAIRKHKDVIPLLMANGCDIHKRGPKNGNTVLHEAVQLGPEPQVLDIIDVLLEFGADPQKKNDKSVSAYEMAIKSGYDSMVKKFTALLADKNLKKISSKKMHADDL